MKSLRIKLAMLEKGSGTNSSKHPQGRSGYWYLTPFPARPRRGFSLVELAVTMTILAIIISIAAPSVTQTMEQSHADLAGAGLRMVNTAQRFYWLENRTYATDLQTLIDDGLIDDDISALSPRYEFSIASADDDSFQAQARRRRFDGGGSPVYTGTWQGAFTMDETGTLAGTVVHGSKVLVPAF